METTPTPNVFLRDVTEADLPIFYEQQLDEGAAKMAAFPSRAHEPFMTHWGKILKADHLIKQTVVADGQVAGNIVSFDQDDLQMVGYWLGRNFWGKGIATQAVKLLLTDLKIRPLYAYVAKHNIASRRVLEKCGFTIQSEQQTFDDELNETVDEYLLVLR